MALDQVALLRGTYEMHQSVPDHLDPKTLILFWDTGGSAGLTPFCSNFINYVECDIDVRDVTKVNKVIGICTTLHKFVDVAGNNVYLPCVSYHLPLTDIRLFSPQVYHQIYDGHSVVNGNEVIMRVREEGRPIRIAIPIDRDGTNLPVVRNSCVSEKIKKKHACRFRSALNMTRLYAALDYFGSLSLSGQSKQGLFSRFQCVGGLVNKNLTMAQKELLLWHWKLSIGMQRLQAMMRNCTFEDPFGRSQVHPPIIQAKFASTSSCAIPRCQSCELTCASVRSPKVTKVQSNIDSEGAISRNMLDIGDVVSTDQFVCRTPGRLPSRYGCEGTNS